MSVANSSLNGSNDTENNEEFAVSFRGSGRYIGTYLAETFGEATVAAFEENDDLEESDEVVVTNVGTGSYVNVFIADVVETKPEEAWENGAGERFSNLEHSDPEGIDAVLDMVRSVDVEGLDRVLERAEEVSRELSQTDFECPVCRLTHKHSPTKHDIRESYEVVPDFENTEMKFSPVCHCGLHELKYLVVNQDDFDGDVFENYGNLERSLTDDEIMLLDNVNIAEESLEKIRWSTGLSDTEVEETVNGLVDLGLVDEDTYEYTKVGKKLQDIRSSAKMAPVPESVKIQLREQYYA